MISTSTAGALLAFISSDHCSPPRLASVRSFYFRVFDFDLGWKMGI